MTGILKDVFLYKGSEVDNNMANFLIDEIYRKEHLILINIEIKNMETYRKKRIDFIKTSN